MAHHTENLPMLCLKKGKKIRPMPRKAHEFRDFRGYLNWSYTPRFKAAAKRTLTSVSVRFALSCANGNVTSLFLLVADRRHRNSAPEQNTAICCMEKAVNRSCGYAVDLLPENLQFVCSKGKPSIDNDSITNRNLKRKLHDRSSR